MYFYPNRRYTLAPLCCINSLHDRPTYNRAPYFNICSVWGSFFVCCVWKVEAFEKVEDSLSAEKKWPLKISQKEFILNFCDKQSYV